MIAYAYNDDRQFIGTVSCQKDPVRSKKSGSDVYLIPANATSIQPPVYDAEKEIPVWNGTEWEIQELPITPVVPKTPSQLREEAYNTEQVVLWDSSNLTVTEASMKWQYYAAEGSEKAAQLQILIAEAKEAIRNRYPDEEI